MISRVLKLMLLSSFFVSCISLQAQTTGAIIGTMQGSSGAVLANAKVKLTLVATAATRSTKTNDSRTKPSFLLPGAHDPTLSCRGMPAQPAMQAIRTSANSEERQDGRSNSR